MPDVYVGAQRISVPAASNLLDALNDAGFNVPYSCRAGSCHACMVRCVDGAVADALPDALPVAKREQGWRLACQCSVLGDLQVALFDPRLDGLPASVCAADWLGEVLRLRLLPERALRYHAGQHLLLWLGGVARPYSLASLPGEDDFLEFHIDCRRPGAFCDQLRRLRVETVCAWASCVMVLCIMTRTGRPGRSGCWPPAPALRRSGPLPVRPCVRVTRAKSKYCM